MYRSHISAMVNPRSPGLWFFVGSSEILLLVHLAEFLYPGYSVSENYISDLAVGPMPSSAIFTVAVTVFGLMSVVTGFLMRQRYPKSQIWILLAFSGIGAVGVGIVNEDSIPVLHSLFALMAFMFGNLAAVYSYRMVRSPLSYLFVFLGLIGLSALVLTGGSTYLGLGPGGMERMIFYPAMFWGIGFGTWLLVEEEKRA